MDVFNKSPSEILAKIPTIKFHNGGCECKCRIESIKSVVRNFNSKICQPGLITSGLLYISKKL